MVAAAIGVAAAASVATGVMGSKAAGKASATQAQSADNAAAAQLQGTREGIQATKDMYAQSRADTAPWRQTGQTALQEIADLYGLGSIAVPGGGSTPVSTTAYSTPLLSSFGSGGAGAPPTYTTGSSGQQGVPGMPDWQATFDQQQGLQNWWNSHPEAHGRYGNDPLAWVRDNYENGGKQAGQPLAYFPAAPAPTTASAASTTPAETAYAASLQTPQVADGANTTQDTRTAGQRQTDARGRFQTSPDYQFTLDQGLQALQRTAAARGNVNSGQQMEAITNYGQGLASTQYNNYVERLASLAGIGGTAASQSASGALSTGANIANLSQAGGNATAQGYLNSGQARASGYLNSANAWGGAFGNLSSAAGLYSGLRP